MKDESPIILTLDAGGTNFCFSAMQNGDQIGEAIVIPAESVNLEKCLETIKNGFEQLRSSLMDAPKAISFGFPGPADYKNGIIGDLPNLPAFRGGVALGPFLEEHFKIPVYINNDGDLFALGESESGFLPFVNGLLEKEGFERKYKNLIGITLGTGFGVGISIKGNLIVGDNNAAAEGWLLRNKQYSYSFIEDTVSIKAVRRIYAEQIAMDPAQAPQPNEIFDIATGKKEGVQPAAIETYLRYGDALGDAIASILTLIDGVVVIGGGVSGAYPLFSRSMLDELNGFYNTLNGSRIKRLIQQVYNLENEWDLKQFLNSSEELISVPNSTKKVLYHKEKKTPIGLSKLGTNNAISKGAYYFAIQQLK
tara:strand:- start:38782 stop:39876 length:1095 start_codon:yes stop_codon:yes gene_type:complete